MRVKKIQDSVATAIRDNRGEADFLDEEEIFELMARHLRALGDEEDDIGKAKENLRYFGDGRRGRAISSEGKAPSESASCSGSAAESVASIATVPHRGFQEVERAAEVPVAIPTQGYFVSIRPGSGFRRLHLLGACGRRPGVDYLLYQFVGIKCPSTDEYHDWCRQCWRSGGPATDYGSDVASSSSSSSSEGGLSAGL
eukprot:1591772-Heterocapsa_arctica.AAC.1